MRSRCKTGIVSNSFVGAREREQAAHGFADLFDVVVYSHEEGCLKPERRIYDIACQRLAVAPAAALMVDDLQTNVDGAIAIGMQAVLHRDNAQTILEIEAALKPDAS